MLQLTRLLYQVLQAVDGQRNLDEVAASVSTASGRLVSADNVRTLIDSQLLPLGLLRLADGSEPEVKKANPLLGMRFRYVVSDPERTRKITSPFARLFHPAIVAAVVVAFLAVCWWVLMVKGLGSATHDAFETPGLLLLILAVTILSAGFHEFGHAAAARRGGATPGAMGAGMYLIWPAFYTDVTDSYRLGRAGRIRTDLGGLYFNAIVAVAIAVIWWATGYDALLLVVVTQILQMVRQLLPLVRFDGYHILADVTGVPDLFQQIKPTLLGLLPWRWGAPENRGLKPWARAVVGIWVLVTVPLLLFSVVMMVLSVPRLLGTAWHSIQNQQAVLAHSLSDGDVLDAAVRVVAILVVAVCVLGIAFLLLRLIHQFAAGVYRRTRGRPAQRATALVVTGAVLASLVWAWWPSAHTYRPVQSYERGTLLDATSSLIPAGNTDLAEGRQGRITTVLPSGAALSTRDEPQLAMLLVPNQESQNAATGTTSPAPTWVFPFEKPSAPEEDGNQALAVNTEDGSVVYDVAFALVWAEEGPVDTTNEAYAFANCTGCTAVAVGFQVVLIVGQVNVIVPENLSAAVTYDCVQCLTYALASQLVLTLDGPLSDEGMAELSALWAEIAEFSHTLQDISFSEIQDRLTVYKQQIMDLIAEDSSATTGASTPATPSPGESTAPASPAPDATEPGATQPDPDGTPAPVAPAPTASPDTSTPAPSPTPAAPTPTPTPSAPAAP
ncbi:hypothetical protein [Microbacterium sp.]|uniref:hypothetical protein n=1 Tax=Microbacterium sp. TaxID=51671 RepID=UPI002811FC6E|nr:hypothetical protein [Microbacterium sp.]